MADDPQTPQQFGVTRKLFRQWRSPRPGRSNPEVMTNPVWNWLIRTELNAYLANEYFKGRLFFKKFSPFKSGPGWCFDRFGQSSTHLADGRTLLIAGEHEDYYDPDFKIYNDVVLKQPDGSIEIYGYPEDIFPPTDFHSATVVGDEILIVGNLGYPNSRQPEKTQVFALSLDDFSISCRETFGTPPGWIHEHKIAMSDDGQSLLLSGGKLDRCDEAGLVENIDEWQLDLDSWHWQRLTERQWPRWKVLRSDEEMNRLWLIQIAAIKQEAGLDYPEHTTTQQFLAELGEIDFELYAQLYRPNVPHAEVPEEEDECDATRIRVQGVVVRYVQEGCEIQVTVEGELPPSTVEILKQDLLEKLQALENTTCKILPIL